MSENDTASPPEETNNQYLGALEKRLRTARLDLMDDPRLTGAGESAPISLRAMTALMSQKLDAAARDGYDALAASLRLHAQTQMLAAGVTADVARGHVDALEKHIKCPSAPPPPEMPAGKIAPSMLALGIFALWAVFAVIIALAANLHPAIAVVLVAIGGVPAVLALRMREAQASSLREKMVREYPVRACRQYMSTAREQLAAYEKDLEQAMAAATNNAA